MSDNGHDQDLPTVSERASRAAVDGWHQRRMDDRGAGYTGLYDALERALKEIPGVVVNDGVGSVSGESKAGKSFEFKYRYATMKQVVAAVREPLLRFGVLFRHGTEHVQKMEGGVLIPVYTDLVHARSGEVVRTKMDIPVVKFTPQAVGSAVTYGKRYTLMAALGIATDDDDDAAQAKPNEIREDPAITLIAAIRRVKDDDALRKWRGDPKIDRAIKQLDGEAFEKVKAAFLEHQSKLNEGA